MTKGSKILTYPLTILKNLPKEYRISELQKKDFPLVRENWPIEKAIETFSGMKERFKVELIQDLAAKGETVVGIYHQGNWFDL